MPKYQIGRRGRSHAGYKGNPAPTPIEEARARLEAGKRLEEARKLPFLQRMRRHGALMPLERIMIDRSLRVADVMALSGFSDIVVRRFRKGDFTKVTIGQMVRMARALGVAPADLVPGLTRVQPTRWEEEMSIEKAAELVALESADRIAKERAEKRRASGLAAHLKVWARTPQG